MRRCSFVQVTVDNFSQSVTVTGSENIVTDVIDKLKSFLLEQTSIEEQFTIGYHQWHVIYKDMPQELESIKLAVQGKDVDVQWQKPSELPEDVNIIIRGEPVVVDEVKGKLEVLVKKICLREETLRHIPVASKVLESMKDKIYVLQTKHGASIDAYTTNDKPSSSQSTADLAAVKYCSATCSNDVRISVYSGDFTRHNQVDTIVVFIPPNPNLLDDSNLKMLFSAGGADLQNDFMVMSSQFLKQNPGLMFQSHPGKLKCSELLHCFLPPWASIAKSNEF